MLFHKKGHNNCPKTQNKCASMKTLVRMFFRQTFCENLPSMVESKSLYQKYDYTFLIRIIMNNNLQGVNNGKQHKNLGRKYFCKTFF